TFPTWAPRAPQWKIRRLYENDAIGLYDDELIDDVAYTLFARCGSFIMACEATQGRASCPRCSRVIPHEWRKHELLTCQCGWHLTWGEYFATIQHNQLSGADPVLARFREYVERLPSARSPREKVLLIDWLIHGFHVYTRTGGPTRPVAVNLIEGRLHQVIEFLDALTYGERSTPGLLETKLTWDERIATARGWRAKCDGEARPADER
ncbi:MAG: hypothetical protein GX620_18720, partial [Chloroflexi bacterium]|nr:hypothetical protein [Chloroflexota bacterium]